MKMPLPRMPLTLLRGIFAVAFSLFLLLGVVQPAMAAGAPASTGQVAMTLIAPDGGGNSGRGVCNAENFASDTSSLPVSRWADGTEKFHDRLHSASPGDIAKSMQRQGVISIFYAVGNTMWKVTTGMTEMAINFCILDRVGGFIDKAAASIGSALMSSGLLAALIVATVLVYAWRIGRGGGGGANSAGLVQKALILGLFGIMLAGAHQSTGGGIGGSTDDYRPGVGAPGWFVVRIDDIVSASANEIAGSLQAQALHGAEHGPNGYGRLGCAPYVKAMKDVYRDSHGTGGTITQASAAVPLLLSNMWEVSGLQMWKKAQFGQDSTYSDYVYCRMLEANSNVQRTPAGYAVNGQQYTAWDDTSVTTLMKDSGAVDANPYGAFDGGSHWKTDTQRMAWGYSTSNTIRDRQWVAWAACAAGPGHDGAALVHEDGGGTEDQLKEQCKQFFNTPGWTGGSGSGEFDWDDSNDDITSAGTSPAAEDFLLTLHGNRNTAGMVTGLVYMISSFFIAAVFVLFSLAIMVAKTAALMIMLMMFVVLATCLLPNSNASKLLDSVKQYVGMSLFAWGAQLVMSIIALVTAILIKAGNSVVPDGPGGVMAIMWTGFAPVIAVFCLHLMFKKARIPSPLKMSGGMAWGQMATGGAIGAAGMGAGVWASRAAQKVGRGASRKGRESLGKVTGKDRRSRMAPAKTRTTTGPTPTGPETGTGTGPAVPENDPTPVEPENDPTYDEDGVNISGIGTGKATRDEKKHARAFAKDNADQVRALRAERVRAAASTRANAAKTKMGGAWNQFKDKPMSTTSNAANRTVRAAPGVAKKTALGAGAFMVVGATGGTAALAVAGGVGVAAVMARRRSQREQGLRSPQDPHVSSSVEAFRTSQHAARTRAAAAEQEHLGLHDEGTGPRPTQAETPSQQAPTGAPLSNGENFEAAPEPNEQRSDTAPQGRRRQVLVQQPVSDHGANVLDENGRVVGSLPTRAAAAAREAERQEEYRRTIEEHETAEAARR